MRKIKVGLRGLYALVDDEDYEDLSQFKWHTARSYKVRTIYAQRRWEEDGTKRSEYMHKRITGYDRTDHANNDGLDNQKSNLRDATQSQNSANVFKRRGNFSSRYKGVSWDKSRNKWVAGITINYKKLSLGRYDLEDDAAKAYDNAARRLFGEFAYLNFKESDDN